MFFSRKDSRPHNEGGVVPEVLSGERKDLLRLHYDAITGHLAAKDSAPPPSLAPSRPPASPPPTSGGVRVVKVPMRAALETGGLEEACIEQPVSQSAVAVEISQCNRKSSKRV